ncbi:ankyrin [Penicillium malachiteum]|uniref:Ankyrin n=1 Tax=Penicillium malachiteum TaxID=1324776 RepID=A0AAD6HDJ0_9EURO|nr:ankyrin [Penicillium malachiteum]
MFQLYNFTKPTPKQRSSGVTELRLNIPYLLLLTTLQRISFSPINVACAGAQRELLLWLIHHALPSANLHDRDANGETPHFSAVNGLNGEVDDTSLSGDTRKREEFISFLLDQGWSVRDSNVFVQQDFNVDNQIEKTVLGAAIRYASQKMVSCLIAEGADVHAQQIWRDHTPMRRSDHIENGAKVTALHIASMFWNLEGIRALLVHPEDETVAEMISSTDDHGRIPLHWALQGTRDEPHRELNKNKEYQSPPRKMDTVQLLVSASPDTISATDRHGATVFNYAVKSDSALPGILAIVKILLDAKPPALNTRDLIGATALQDAMVHHSRRMGGILDPQFAELVDTLLDNGADAHLSLHKLFAGSWLDSISTVMIEHLLKQTDINETDADGCTAMHYAVRNMDQIDATRYLISRGADVTVKNHKGDTPLHNVMGGTMIWKRDENKKPLKSHDTPIKVRAELIQMLIDAGGSMDFRNAAGQTPTQMLEEVDQRRKMRARQFFPRPV